MCLEFISCSVESRALHQEYFCLLNISIYFQEPSIRPPVERAVPSDHPVPGIESPARTKEADQPSPVSVLEVPFTDDASSSPECFESLNADLQGNWKTIYIDYFLGF